MPKHGHAHVDWAELLESAEKTDEPHMVDASSTLSGQENRNPANSRRATLRPAAMSDALPDPPPPPQDQPAALRQDLIRNAVSFLNDTKVIAVTTELAATTDLVCV